MTSTLPSAVEIVLHEPPTPRFTRYLLASIGEMITSSAIVGHVPFPEHVPICQFVLYTVFGAGQLIVVGQLSFQLLSQYHWYVKVDWALAVPAARVRSRAGPSVRRTRCFRRSMDCAPIGSRSVGAGACPVRAPCPVRGHLAPRVEGQGELVEIVARGETVAVEVRRGGAQVELGVEEIRIVP